MAVPVKDIRYNKEDRDYSVYINGELAQIVPTYLAAKDLADSIVYEMLARQSTASISDLTPEDAAVLLELKELERAAGVDHFDALDAKNVGAPTPIYINTVQEAAFAAACLKRRKQTEQKASRAA